jgi:hypothetical protein
VKAPPGQFVRHTAEDGEFRVLKLDIGEVHAMRGEGLRARIFIDETLFSVAFAQQRLCYTVCRANIVVWCVANFQIIRRIDLAGVDALALSPDRGAVFAGLGREVLQFTVSGTLVRKVECWEKVTAVAVAPALPWDGEVVLAVGTRTGEVGLIGWCQGGGELVLVGEPRPSRQKKYGGWHSARTGRSLLHRPPLCKCQVRAGAGRRDDLQDASRST